MIVAIILAAVIGALVGFLVARLLVQPKCAGTLYLCKHENGDPIDLYTELSSPPDTMLGEKFVYFKVHISNVKSQK